MATKYRLTSEALRVVQSDDKGKVTYRRRYKKGQIVDVTKMDQDRLDLFIDKGYLVDVDADPEPDPEEVKEDPTEETTEPETAPEPTEESTPQEEPKDNPEETPETGPSAEDVYDRMPYAELQQEAKARTGNGAGNAAELQARLRQADVDDAAQA